MYVEAKIRFLKDEFFMLSWNGAVGHNTVYAANVDDKEKKDFRKSMKGKVFRLLKDYESKEVTGEHHIKNIESIMDESKNHSEILKDGSINCGTAQKLLNLFLKYCWCAGFIQTPPHMPVDSIVNEKLCKEAKHKEKKFKSINWTKDFPDTQSYKQFIDNAESIVGESLSEWELKQFNER